MFTGIIEQTGLLVSRSKVGATAGKLALHPQKPFSNLILGESIAINGVCLTLEKELENGSLLFHTLAETLERSNLGELLIGSSVNIERALLPTSRLGGHFVSGHIDQTARLIEMSQKQDDVILKVEMPTALYPYIIPKGSIAIDGISLTVVDVQSDYFTVHLIPTTLNETALKMKKQGAKLNLETDLLGKYIVHQLGLHKDKSSISMETLLSAGF